MVTTLFAWHAWTSGDIVADCCATAPEDCCCVVAQGEGGCNAAVGPGSCSAVAVGEEDEGWQSGQAHQQPAEQEQQQHPLARQQVAVPARLLYNVHVGRISARGSI